MQTFNELKRNLKKTQEGYKSSIVSLLGDTATQLLAVALKGAAMERGYTLDLYEAEYNQVERQLMDPTSELYAHQAQYTLIFQSTHKLLEHFSTSNVGKRTALAEERIAFLRHACESIQGKVICFNYPEIEDVVSSAAGYKNTEKIRKVLERYYIQNCLIKNKL